MIKTLKIGNKEVHLTNNVGWALVYRDQFRHDIISTLTPMLAVALDLSSGFLQTVGTGKKEVTAEDILEVLDGETFINALSHFAGLEFVDLINITWAMAKAYDDSLPEPRVWVKDFDEFPVDEIAPEVAKLVFTGLVSTKNLKRLMNLLKSVKGIQPLTLTQSSSQDLNGD